MAVAGRRQPGVASPAVGVNCRPRLHGFLQEGQQALGGDVLDAPKADAPDAAPALFSHHRDDGLALDRTAPLAFFRAAHIGFVGLDLAGKAVAAGPAPWPAAACAARSRRSRSCRGRGHAAAPGRSPRSSGWSRTTSPGTMSAAACASPRRWCRPSATSLQHMPGSETPHAPLPTAPQSLRIAGKRTPPANAAAGRSPGIPPRCGTTYPSPGTSAGNQSLGPGVSHFPSPNVTRRPYLGEGDTHLAEKPARALRGAIPRPLAQAAVGWP